MSDERPVPEHDEEAERRPSLLRTIRIRRDRAGAGNGDAQGSPTDGEAFFATAGSRWADSSSERAGDTGGGEDAGPVEGVEPAPEARAVDPVVSEGADPQSAPSEPGEATRPVVRAVEDWEPAEFLIDLDNGGRYQEPEPAAPPATPAPVAPSPVAHVPDRAPEPVPPSDRGDRDEPMPAREPDPIVPEPAVSEGSGPASDGPATDQPSVALETETNEAVAADGLVRGAPDLEPSEVPATTGRRRRSTDRRHPVGERVDALSRVAPELLVGLAVLFGLITQRAQRLPVAYPNDSSVHSLTVAWATSQLKAGHFPLDGWFPYLSLGSPFFLHYQSISAVIAGALGIVIGSANSFGWTLYLLLATWPISVYFGARLLGFSRWTAAAAAAASPLIFSSTGYGLEFQSYDWYGSGLWSQLWGMWLLPITLGYGWRAVNQRRHLFAAVLTFGLLISFHFLTAYLVGLLIVVFVFLKPTQDFLRRLGRAALVGVGSALVAGWVLIPLFVTDQWSATNEFEVGQFWDNGYGAKEVLGALIHGHLFDSGLNSAALGRFPIFSILAAIGAIVSLVTVRRDERSRVVIAVAVVSLLLTFGRTTFGSAVNILPFNSQLLLHRYVMGIDLAGILLVGIGIESIYQLASSGVALARIRVFERMGTRAGMRGIGSIALVGVVVAGLAPAWTEIASYGSFNAVEIGYQRQIDSTQGADVNELVKIAENLGGGRIYAGLPSNWGRQFLVGSVPVYIYLADEGVDAVGFTLRTSSLMTDPEAYFDDSNLGDYAAFGIHYLLLPLNRSAPVSGAKFIQQAGNYALWIVPTTGYIHVVDTTGSIVANGTDLGRQTAAFLGSSEIDLNRYPTVAFDGSAAAPDTLTSAEASSTQPPGTVIAERDDLVEGSASATVAVNRTSVVLLSASFDGGWRVTVDGRPATPIMVAPALVGVTVAPGDHVVSFVYQAYPYYPELFGLSVLTLLGFLFVPKWWRRRRASVDADGDDSPPEGGSRDSDEVDPTELLVAASSAPAE